MNHLPLNRSAIVNLKKYSVTITTAFEPRFGISGHLFEMIEYFIHLRMVKGINACILVSDGTTRHEFETALVDRYDLTDKEMLEIYENTYFEYKPMTLIADTLLVVNGSTRFANATIIANKKFMFRCCVTEDLDNNGWIVLQDDEVYGKPLTNSVHYKKKILFDKFKKIPNNGSKVAMFYGKSNSKALTTEQIIDFTKQYNQFEQFLVLTDLDIDVPSNVELAKIPVDNLWNRFGTYIYTHPKKPGMIDCSPRFVAECAFYNKDVILAVSDVDKGLAVRLHDMEHGDVWLRDSDDICTKIQ